MIRNDFVSNSSSSSFIVSAEDNKYDILLQNYRVFTLEEYIKYCFTEDCLGYYSPFSDDEKIRYVSNTVFNREFAYSIRRTLPFDCKDLMDQYIELYKKHQEYDYKSKQYKKYLEELEAVKDLLKKKVTEILEMDWKDVKFHQAEIDDHCYMEKERDDGIDSNEELVEERIDYMNSLKPLKFSRKFCHH